MPVEHADAPSLRYDPQMPLEVTSVEPLAAFHLRVSFNDQTTGTVDVRPLLWGEMFEPLLDPDVFSRVFLDEGMGTVAWPNGADLSPDALYKCTRFDA